MVGRQSDGSLSACASFREKSAEANFRLHELDTASLHLRVALPLIGILFAAFAVPDWMVLGPGKEFALAVAARAAFLVLCIAAAHFMGRGTSLLARELIMAAVTLTGIAAFGAEVYAYRDADFNLQAMSVLLMICAVYLLPNRFWFSVFSSFLLVFIGIASMEARHLPLSAMERPGYIADYLLMAALSAAIWHRTCRARRLEYSKALELERLARVDSLTGAGNRRAFEERLRDAISRHRRYGEPSAVIMLDLDAFKRVNDQYGHDRGDAVLLETANRLAAALRSTDSLSRWGGEEFVVLAARTAAGAVELAERLRSELADLPYEKAGTVTASLGVTLLQDGDDADSAMGRADKALYLAKAKGRNRVETDGLDQATESVIPAAAN
jgi:diguanylate cyclase (GGDEF)-like protein